MCSIVGSVAFFVVLLWKAHQPIPDVAIQGAVARYKVTSWQ